MATTTALDLISRPSQVPAGSRRVGGSREGATAVRFEDVLRELDRAGQPATDGGANAPGTGRPEERARAGTRDPEAGTKESQARGEEPEMQGSGAEEAPASAPRPSGASGQTAPTASVIGVSLDSQGTAAEGMGPGTQGGLPAEAAAGEAPGSVHRAGALEQAALQAGAGFGLDGPAAGLPGEVQGGLATVAIPAEAAPVAGEVPVSGPAAPQVPGTTPVPAASESTLAPEPDRDPLVEALASQKGGKVPSRPAAPNAGETWPEGAAEALLKGLTEGRETAAAVGGSQAPDPSAEADQLLRAALAGELRARTPGQDHGGPTTSPQGEGEGSPGVEARWSLSQLLEEAGLRLEEEGEPLQPQSRPSSSQPGNESGALARQVAASPSAEAEPVPVAAQGATGAQAPAAAGAEAQAGMAAPEAPSSTAGASGPPPAEGGAASAPLAQVSDLVVKRLQQLRNPGSDELRLELEPKELGSLKIRLELRGDGVKAQFVVDRPVVQAMLDRAMAELRQNLADQGYQVEELHVALQGDEGQDREPFGDRGQGTRRSRGLRAGAVEAVAVPEASASQWTPDLGPGRIDIRA